MYVHVCIRLETRSRENASESLSHLDQSYLRNSRRAGAVFSSSGKSQCFRSVEPTTMPRTAWNLYFRFCSITARHPRLQIDVNELRMLDKEQFKTYVLSILNADSTCTDGASEQKYGGCDSFGGMSKDIGQQWKDADALTRAAFKELASEDMKRHKKVCCLLACTGLGSTSTSYSTSTSHMVFSNV